MMNIEINIMDYVSEGQREARNLAIEALQEPKPVCEDAISRADTIKAMCQECKVFLGDGVNCADCTEVAIIKGMPPVNQKQITGKLENAEITTSEGEESTMGQPKSKLESDLISRQAVIGLILDAQDGSGQTYEAIRDLLHEVAYMPPVEPKPVCEDCIDRYAVLAELDPKSYEYKVVKELPSVEPKQSKGEWKCMADCGVTECDQCGWNVEEYVGDYNFCPNCVADMRGDKE